MARLLARRVDEYRGPRAVRIVSLWRAEEYCDPTPPALVDRSRRLRTVVIGGRLYVQRPIPCTR